MTDLSPKQPQPEDSDNGQTRRNGSVVHRKLSVKGSGGVSATMVVTALQGQVWVSIVPPLTWEAIMEPVKVDELIRTLGLAREDAKHMVSGKRAFVEKNNNQSVVATSPFGARAATG